MAEEKKKTKDKKKKNKDLGIIIAVVVAIILFLVFIAGLYTTQVKSNNTPNAKNGKTSTSTKKDGNEDSGMSENPERDESEENGIDSENDDQISESEPEADSDSSKKYKIGETWVIDGQWSVTVNSVEETQQRNEYSEKNPAAVYLVTYTYQNIGYVDQDGIMDGLFIDMENSIVDSVGQMGYAYPGDKTLYAQETPVGATCQAQACIGVDNPGSFKIHVTEYDGNGNKQSAIFSVDF